MSPLFARLPAVAVVLACSSFAHAEAPAPGTLTRPPELLQFVEAPFPAEEAGRTASVVLAVTIGAEGAVEDVTVQESAGPAFDAAAVEAARQFRFSPAEIDGVPARVRILYRYDFVERVAAIETATFAGVVMDRERKVPVPDVTVTLADGRSVVTDAAGRFVVEEIPPGATQVTLEGPRLTPLSTDETFVAGERLDTIYEVFLAEEGEEGDDLEILVTAPTIKRQAFSTEIAADAARKVPGTQGDVLKVVENMPGVARASLGTGALVVWGAAPEDTGVYIDGVPVPRLYHDGGLRSVMGSELVKSVELVPGGYGAGYGRGLGGLVSVKTKGLAEETNGAVSADLYDAAASLSGPIGDKVSYAAGGRYGYVGPLLSSLYPQVEEYFPIPHYYDAQARVGVRLGPGETLDLTGLLSSDYTERTSPNPDPAREASEAKSAAFQRVSLRYLHDLGDGGTVSALLFVGADQSDRVARFGQVDTSISQDVRLAGLRASYRSRVTSFLTAEAGVDALVSASDIAREGSIAVPAREGDMVVFGQPPPDQVSSDQYTVVSLNVAPYAEADLGLFDDRLHIVPGLRFDPYARSVSRAAPQVGTSPTNGLFLQDPSVEPRLALRFAPTERLSFTAAFGRYRQQPQAADLSASFGNPALPASSATHGVLGAGVRPTDTLSIDVSGFYTVSEELATRNAAEQPAQAEALVAAGAGRTYGAQGMIRLDPTAGFYGWLSYTLAWSERQDSPEGAWRPSDYDQRHVLTVVGGYTLPFGIEVGVRGRLGTGAPRTEVVGAYFDDRRHLYQPMFGEHNAIRLPTFFQADARVAKELALGTTLLELSLEVQNVTNRENVEEYIYDADYSSRGSIDGLPILPVLGARWSF
ncbi:MAG: TonB-dependent receptor [Myxococcota bacterium]